MGLVADRDYELHIRSMGERYPAFALPRYEYLDRHRRVEIFAFADPLRPSPRTETLRMLDEWAEELAEEEWRTRDMGLGEGTRISREHYLTVRELRHETYAIRCGYWLVEHYDDLIKAPAPRHFWADASGPFGYFFKMPGHTEGPRDPLQVPWPDGGYSNTQIRTWVTDIKRRHDDFLEKKESPPGVDADEWNGLEKRAKFVEDYHGFPGLPDAVKIRYESTYAGVYLAESYAGPRTRRLERLRTLAKRDVALGRERGHFYFDGSIRINGRV